MSLRLVRQIERLGKGRKDLPVVMFTKSGRAFIGNMGKCDAVHGTVVMNVDMPHPSGSLTTETWKALIAVESIEAISPSWETSDV